MMSKRPGPYEKIDFFDIYDRIERIEKWIKNYELKRKKESRFWEILQSYSDKEIVAKGSERLTKEIDEQVEQEFKEK